MVTSFTTLVLGASINPERYSYRAVEALQKRGYKVVAMGIKEGTIGTVPIVLPLTKLLSIHTISLYLSPKRHKDYLGLITQLKPQRVIFNPGTENPLFASELTRRNIAWENACTLVLLSTNQYESNKRK